MITGNPVSCVFISAESDEFHRLYQEMRGEQRIRTALLRVAEPVQIRRDQWSEGWSWRTALFAGNGSKRIVVNLVFLLHRKEGEGRINLLI